MKKFAKLILVLSITLVPIYLWSSGGIQISHGLFGFFVCGYIFAHGLQRESFESVLLFLVVYIFLRESIFIIFSGHSYLALMPGVYLLFNLLLVNVLRRVAQKDGWLPIIKYGVNLSLLLAVVGVIMVGYGLRVDVDAGRSVGTFNNPNQLGYFSVCIMSIALLLRSSKNISKLNLLIFIASSLFLAIASLSKAAMISVFFATTFSIFTFSNYSKKIIVIVLIILSTFTYLFVDLYYSNHLDDYSFTHRLKNIGSQDDDSLQERGYYVMANATAIEIIMGMDSGKVNDIVGHEVHSTIFSYIANYGLIGGGLIIAVMFMWTLTIFRSFGIIGVFMIVMPSMFYGITHNGSRFTIFWILIALSFGIASPYSKKKRISWELRK